VAPDTRQVPNWSAAAGRVPVVGKAINKMVRNLAYEGFISKIYLIFVRHC